MSKHQLLLQSTRWRNWGVFFPLVSSAEVMTTCGITEAEIEMRKVSFVFKSNFWTFFLMKWKWYMGSARSVVWKYRNSTNIRTHLTCYTQGWLCLPVLMLTLNQLNWKMIQAKCWLATSQFRASQENNTLSAKTCVCIALWKMLQTLEPRYGIPSQRGFSTEREEAVGRSRASRR